MSPHCSTYGNCSRSPPVPTKVVIPNLALSCGLILRFNRHGKRVGNASNSWLFRGSEMNKTTRDEFNGLKCGLLASACYPDAAYPQLLVACDFMNYLFHLDDLSDDMDTLGTTSTADMIMNTLHHPFTFCATSRLGKLVRGFWKRLILTASIGTQERFKETFDLFFQAVTQQAHDRKTHTIPDIESYILLRRDTSGCKPCFALIEYANNLDIPEEVMEHPLVRGLGDAANDYISWSNDIYSYNTEQVTGSTHNLVVVVMNQKGLDLQSAIDYVGKLCNQTLVRFNEDRENLPSWSPEIDKQIAIYVDGLANWMIGNLFWSFQTERYLGLAPEDFNTSFVVNLLPRRP